MDVGTTEKTAEIMSLQARIEQCEAAINAAHDNLDSIEPRPSGEGVPAIDGAMAAIERCNTKMADLNDRLSGIAEKVGTL